jgi:hypothetical protein
MAVVRHRGTEFSNPFPSSSESGELRFAPLGNGSSPSPKLIASAAAGSCARSKQLTAAVGSWGPQSFPGTHGLYSIASIAVSNSFSPRSARFSGWAGRGDPLRHGMRPGLASHARCSRLGDQTSRHLDAETADTCDYALIPLSEQCRFNRALPKTGLPLRAL